MRKQLTQTLTGLLMVVSLLLLSGCGSSSQQPKFAATVAVKGRVTYQGKPLTGGNVRFEPDDAVREAHGTIGPDGTYSMTTFNADDGAVPGLHRVGISNAGGVSLPAKFGSPGSSGIEVNVVEGNTSYDLEIR